MKMEITRRIPGPAGLTRTQQIMRKKSPKQMPPWVWRNRAFRPCMKNGTDLTYIAHNVDFKLDMTGFDKAMGKVRVAFDALVEAHDGRR